MKPIIDPSQLTEEQKRIIRVKYKDLMRFNTVANDLFAGAVAILRWLFGEEMFNQNKE